MKRKVILDCLEIAIDRIKKHPQYKQYIHYSFVVQDNKIVGYGVNRAASPCIGYPEHGKLHSEVDAWNKCKGLLDKDLEWSMVNIRLGRQKTLKLSKPCHCCFEFIRRLGCKEVWFSTETIFASIRF